MYRFGWPVKIRLPQICPLFSKSPVFFLRDELERKSSRIVFDVLLEQKIGGHEATAGWR